MELVEQLPLADTATYKHTVVWAWQDQKSGIIRARTFAADWGIPEDQANGSGAMILAANFQRNLTIIHGEGSFIYAKPVDNNFAMVGGRCYKI